MPSLHDLVAPGLEILKAQQAWAIPLLFALAFARSLAVVALIIPGNAVLMGAGAMIAGGYLELTPVALAIVMGAGLGNWLSYWIGHTFQDRIHQFKYFRKRPDLLPRGEAFFNKYGAASIVLARFIGPLRATVPILAGMLGMPAATFQIANWASAALWGGAMLGAGAMVVKSAV